MMTVDARKDDTLKIRMDSATLELMERARGLLDLDRSKFIRQSVRHMAETVITEHEKTRLSVQDWQQFFDMLDRPPEPTERIKKAARKYREISRSDST